VHRRHHRPGQPLGGWGRSGPEGEPEDHCLGRSRGGYSTKLHLLTDANGIPLAPHLTAGQRHESRAFEALMGAVRLPRRRGRPRTRPRQLLGDKAYSSPRIRRYCRGRGIRAVIPRRKDELRRKRPGRPPGFDKRAYRQRSAVEQAVGWLKECRSVGTRFDKLALNFLAMAKLACIRLILRRLQQPSDKA
jgi:transposase